MSWRGLAPLRSTEVQSTTEGFVILAGKVLCTMYEVCSTQLPWFKWLAEEQISNRAGGYTLEDLF